MAHFPTVLLIFLASVTRSTLPLASTNEAINAECPMPYQNVGGQCLFFNTLGEGTWNDMRDFCHSLQGEMVKIHDANFLYDIVNFIHSEGLSQDCYWIGARDEGHEGDWRWTDGSEVLMGTPFWGTWQYPVIQEPSGGSEETCACLPKAFKYFMGDCTCTSPLSVICEYGIQL